MSARALSLGWILLPLIPFLRSGWKTLLAFMIVPVLITLCSVEQSQYRMEHHYPALVASFMGITMIHVAATRFAFSQSPGIKVWIAVVWLLGATGVSFYAKGLVVGSHSAQVSTVYRSVSGPGPHILHVALNHLPKDGIMTAPKGFRSLLANRRDLLWSSCRGVESNPQVAVAMERNGRVEPALVAGVSNGTWRVLYTDEAYTVFQRVQDAER